MAKGKKTGGRRPGSKNKLTVSVRESIIAVFHGLGGIPAMQSWAKANETAYYNILARLIPQEHVGAGGDGPVQTIVKHIYEEARPK
jgi:hypothetical protein